MLAIANWLYFAAGGILANRQAVASAAAVGRLVTTGVYAKVRHPIYSADIILAWGIFFYMPTLKVLASVMWLTIVLMIWMKLEEYALEQRFGQEYVQYKARTPMIIPNYFAKG